MGDQPDNTEHGWTDAGWTWPGDYQYIDEHGEEVFVVRGVRMPDACVVPDAPAWCDGRGQFTSRLPYGDTLVTGLHHYAGTVDDFDNSVEDDIWMKLDGALCIMAARARIDEYLFDAFIEKVGHPILELLKGLIPGLLITIAGVAVVTLAGAVIGGLAGVPSGGTLSPLGAGIGAEFAFNLSMFVITWIGFGFLTSMLASSIIEAGELMQRGILSAWNARGMEGHGRELMIDIGAHDIARGIAVVFRAILEGIVLFVIGKDAVRFTRGLALSADKFIVYMQTLVQEGGRLDWVLSQMRMTQSLAELADWIQAHIYDLLSDPRTNPLLRPGKKGGAGAAEEAPPLPKEEPPPAQKPAPKEEPPPEKKPQTNAEKGVFGEAKADEYMVDRGYEKLNGPPVKIGDQPIGTGIDGVWKNPSPPPEYVITDAKYGSAGLGKLKDGTKQMSPKWIDKRLNKAVGEVEADRIRDAMAQGRVERWVLKVDEAGKVTRVLLTD
ncbi:MAG TPA: hypothetical protein VF297_15930 [Pyrinomonadaceae bacterium]